MTTIQAFLNDVQVTSTGSYKNLPDLLEAALWSQHKADGSEGGNGDRRR
jgi:hypothetical protein